MGGGYIICEYEAIKRGFPEYATTMEAVRRGIIAKGMDDWKLPYGGLQPKAGEFGGTPIMPELFQDGSANTLVTWRQTVPALGHQILIRGNQASGVIPEDYKVGFIGLAFLDDVLRITEVKLQISDKKIGRINIEEMMAYEQPCLVLQDGYFLDEETGFDLFGFAESVGQIKIKLLGMQVNRVPNKLQVTNTGAPLA